MKKLHMGPAHCALDLGDGSERAEYVSQDYILHRLGRPHRAVNIMYTCYPHDSEWPARISEAWKDRNVTFAWDYPYDDYPPYGVNGQPFAQMRDIRRHGQDVLLTLTLDCALSDAELREIALQLRPFGRMMLRINHECTGSWFQHNKRYTFAEVGAFFVRFAGILRETAPNVRIIFCGGGCMQDGRMDQEDAFLESYRAADLWSWDTYPALHFGWPYDIAEAGGGSYKADSIGAITDGFTRMHRRLTEITGQDKPVMTAEFNADGDVTGPRMQGESVVRFAHYWRDHRIDWFRSISLYQFRDRGRLGLECEDPNNPAVGVEQPLLAAYRDEVLHDPWFMPAMTEGEEAAFPAEMRWGGAEDADGLAIPVRFEGNPEFCEMTVEQEIGLMAELNGRWFYKAPGTKTIDLMSAFFDRPLTGPAVLTLRLFAPPPEGVNVEDGHADWAENYRAVLQEAPALRIRYEVPGVVG